MTRAKARGQLHIAPSVDLLEVRHCMEGGRSAEAMASLYGVTVKSLERIAHRAGQHDLADMIRERAA
jgi:hypothetical protein